MHDTPYAITPSDSRGASKRVHSAPVAINPDRDMSALDQLPEIERLHLLAAAARMALCAVTEE